MKCPNCGNPNLKYDTNSHARSREDRLGGRTGTTRTDFKATCKKCGWTMTSEQIRKFLAVLEEQRRRKNAR